MLYLRIGVILRLPRGSDLEIECVIDMGFEGFLTLPLAASADLELLYLMT
jgi:predicted aspartyl protease